MAKGGAIVESIRIKTLSKKNEDPAHIDTYIQYIYPTNVRRDIFYRRRTLWQRDPGPGGITQKNTTQKNTHNSPTFLPPPGIPGSHCEASNGFFGLQRICCEWWFLLPLVWPTSTTMPTTTLQQRRARISSACVWRSFASGGSIGRGPVCLRFRCGDHRKAHVRGRRLYRRLEAGNGIGLSASGIPVKCEFCHRAKRWSAFQHLLNAPL